MSDNTPSSGFARFWTSVSGILTAAAAVITAIGGIYLATKDAPSPSSTITSANANLSGTGSAAPNVTPDASLHDVAVVEPAFGSNTSLVDSCAAGSDDACMQIVQILVQECDYGSGEACDYLYLISPVGSDIEWFGATCGGRLGEQYAGMCSSL